MRYPERIAPVTPPPRVLALHLKPSSACPVAGAAPDGPPPGAPGYRLVEVGDLDVYLPRRE